MNEKILECTSRIEKELKRLKNRLHIDDLLLKMESNVEVRKLKAQIAEKIKNIEVLQRFLNVDSREIKEIIAEISSLKIKLYEIKEVKKYNKALAKYNKYIDYINEEIFRI